MSSSVWAEQPAILRQFSEDNSTALKICPHRLHLQLCWVPILQVSLPSGQWFQAHLPNKSLMNWRTLSQLIYSSANSNKLCSGRPQQWLCWVSASISPQSNHSQHHCAHMWHIWLNKYSCYIANVCHTANMWNGHRPNIFAHKCQNSTICNTPFYHVIAKYVLETNIPTTLGICAIYVKYL